MNLTDDDTLKFLKGTPIFLEDICAIYPVTIGEIVDEGYSNFQQYLSILTAEKPVLTKKEDKKLKQILDELTDFQYVIMMVTMDLQSNEIFRNACRFFFHEKQVTFSLEPAQIIFGSLEEQHILDEGKFYDLQKILRRMYFIDSAEDDNIIIYSYDDPIVKKLKMQMKERREKLRKAKAKKAEKNQTNLKFSDLIGSVTIDNCGLNISNIWGITYYAFHDQLTRMGWRDQFQINNQAAMAGAKLKQSQLKHWMRSISDEKL